MSIPFLATGYARANLINLEIVIDTPTLHIAFVDYTFPLIDSFVEINTPNWSWSLFEGEFGEDPFLDDFDIVAFHEIGPHGEAVPNGPLGGLIFDVPLPGEPAIGTYFDFLLHGKHLDTLQVSFDPIAEGVSLVTIILEHNIPEPAVATLLVVACLLLPRRRRGHRT